MLQPMNLAGYVLSGRYELLRHLADGGMGAVWTARDRVSGGMVAVKLMLVEGIARADLRARFEQEARAARLLQDPHIVQVLDFGTEDDTPFIVMELLDGVDLLATRRYARTWPLAEVAELLVQVARGLGTAHRAGIIHRDVKPANIFLVRDARSEHVVAKLIDFGIAKWADSNLRTATNVALGSPSYMSPEQIRGLKVDGRVDVWALAVVAFTLITGELPVAGRNGSDIAKQIVLGHRRRIPPSLPNAERLDWFFDRAFAPQIGARFGSVEELAGEFVRAAEAPSPLWTAARAVHAAQSEEAQPDPEPNSDDVETYRLVKQPKVPAGSSTERLVPSRDTPEDEITTPEPRRRR